jgi:hypothetical protein
MKKTFLSALTAVALGTPKVIRARTRDVAFTYRMGAGFAGDINRTHPFDCVAERQDVSDPIALYGDGCLMDTVNGTVRAVIAADQSDSVAISLYGVLVRPFPTQQANTTQGLGNTAPAIAPAILDILTEGFIMVKVNGTPTKRGPVFIWTSASAGAHVVGGFESAADAGDTVRVLNAYFNGPPDAAGVVEMRVWNQGI